MNWDAIGAIGEAVGALGVIASLGYLAIQIRAQNRESQVEATSDWTNQRSIYFFYSLSETNE